MLSLHSQWTLGLLKMCDVDVHLCDEAECLTGLSQTALVQLFFWFVVRQHVRVEYASP